ncbi:MAG: ferrous iron transport protein A [Proteobacteria bacterium]|nr:ferrous iron transport protein A [Pseudomonadota bacterium]
MCLVNIKKGQTVAIVRIEDEDVRTQFIRFGISEGSQIKCLEIIPFGPLMLKHNRQEIAIGREVANTIFVSGRL